MRVVHCSGLGCGPKYSFALSPARIELRTLIVWDGRQLVALVTSLMSEAQFCVGFYTCVLPARRLLSPGFAVACEQRCLRL